MKVFKKIMAILAVLVIIALYAAVFLCAIFIKKVGNEVFLASIVVAVSIPLLVYLVFWLYRLFRPKPSVEEESWEVKTKKGFQEAAAFNNPTQLKSFAGKTLSCKEIAQESKEEDDEA